MGLVLVLGFGFGFGLGFGLDRHEPRLAHVGPAHEGPRGAAADLQRERVLRLRTEVGSEGDLHLQRLARRHLAAHRVRQEGGPPLEALRVFPRELRGEGARVGQGDCLGHRRLEIAVLEAVGELLGRDVQLGGHHLGLGLG